MLNTEDQVQVDFYYQSPIGWLQLTGNDQEIISLVFVEQNKETNTTTKPPITIKQCCQQLDEYFAGKRTSFTIPYRIKGTTFQKQAWQALTHIPYGKTWSYGQQASFIKNPKAARAIGGANNKNPLSIIIPCHRVIGANGQLVGYGGTLPRKKWLLEHEKTTSSRL